MPIREPPTTFDTSLGKSESTSDDDEPPRSVSPSLYGQDASKGRRTSRACDQCRKTKTRCDHGGNSNVPCRSCLLAGYECTFFEPTQKRGPPKGYLSALENRLHEAEALLGVILSTSDVRAKSLISDLAVDPLASSIIKRVTNSVFGPVGRAALRGRGPPSQGGSSLLAREPTDSRRQQMNSREVALMGGEGKRIFTTPSNAWQDYLCDALSAKNSHFCGMNRSPGRPPSSGGSSTSNELVDGVLRYLTPQGSTELLAGANAYSQSTLRGKISQSAESSPVLAHPQWYMPDDTTTGPHHTKQTMAPALSEYLSAASTSEESFPYGWNIPPASSGLFSVEQNSNIAPHATVFGWGRVSSSGSSVSPME